MLNRRSFLASAASLAFTPANADDNGSPVAHGILADNPLALAFETAPAQLPDVLVLGPNGTRNISEFKGRTLLMPLWAEWCAPCLSELQDFASLQQKHGNDKFAIVPILSGTQKRMTPATVAQLFTYLHADALEPLIENHFGNRLLTVMARGTNREVEIPCNLLVAPDGHVVGREFGMKEAGGVKADSRHQMLAQAEAGHVLSEWGKQAGDEFAAAMANGFLG
jgi:thiol-disulfide isomerase/thioredoxin